MTASRNFPCRKRLENVQWRFSSLCIPRSLPRYPVAAVYVSFTSSSNAPRFQEASQNLIGMRIYLAPGNIQMCCRITDLKIINRLAFRFLDCMLSSSTDRVETNFPLLGQTVCRSFRLANRKIYLPILPLDILFYSAIQIVSRILLHPILVDFKERIVGCLEADLGVVCRDC